MNARYLLILLIHFISGIRVFGQVAFTVNNGNWNDTSVWSGHRIPDASFDAITIRHAIRVQALAYPASTPLIADQITIGSDGFAGSLIIEPGAVVQLNDGTGVDLAFEGTGHADVSGRVVASTGVTFAGNTTSNFNFLSGSVYEHQYASATTNLPAASYSTTSTLIINGFTGSGTFTNAWSVPLGNVVYNCPGQGSGTVNFAGFLSQVNGNLDIQNTGTGSVYFNESGTSTSANASAIVIAGNFSISGISRVFLTATGTVEVNVGGVFTFSPALGSGTSQCATSGSGTLQVNGTTNMSSGTWNFSSSTNGSGTFNLNGNLLSWGAILTETGSGTSQGNLNFNATDGLQTFDGSGVAPTTLNVSVNNSNGVMLSGNLTLGGALSLNRGNLILPGTSLTLNGPIAQNEGIIATMNSPSLIIGGSGSLPFDLSIGGDSTLQTFQLNRPASIFTSSSNITVTTLELYAGTFVNKGKVNLTPGALVDMKATSSTAGALMNPLFSSTSYDLHYTNSAALSTGPEVPSHSGVLHNFTKSGTGTLTLASDLTINGDLNLSSGTLSDGDSSRSITLVGNFFSNGNSSLTSSTFTFASGNSGKSLSGSIGPTFGNLNFLDSVLITTSFRADSNLYVAQGIMIKANSGTASFGGTTTFNNQGILDLNAVTVLSNGTLTVNQFPFQVSGTLTVSSSGSFTANDGADLTLYGNLSVTGTFASNARVIFADTTKMTGTGTKIFKDILITGALTPNSTYTVTGNLLLSDNGTLNAGTSTTTFGGTTTVSNAGTGTITFNNITLAAGQSLTTQSDLTITGATMTWNSGSFFSSAVTRFARVGTTTVRGTGSYIFTDIAIASGTTFTPDAPYTITGNLLVNGVMRAGNNTTTLGGTTSITTTGTPTISFNHLTIGSRDSLTAYSGNMTVNGNFTNNGFFNANGGTITFAGSTTKNISSTTNTRFNNINISNGTAATDVSIEGSAELAGVLTLATNAHLDADGLNNTGVFTLLSLDDDPTQDASVATLPTGAQILGNVTVQRYISLEGADRKRIYRYLSSSVSNAAVSDFQNEIPVTGLFAGSSSCSGCLSNPSMFWYDETVITGGVNAGYTAFPASANTEVFIPGRGYAAFVRGNIDPVLTAGSAKYDLRGPINSGLINYNVTYTSSGVPADDGWNLVGNPYPSSINWNSSGWTKTNVGGSIYMLDNGANPSRYAVWNGTVGINGGSGIIAAGQGFFIQTTSTSPLLTSTESVKVAGTQTTYFREGSPDNVLRIALVQGTMRDESVIHFRDSATNGFDAEYDAIKLKNLSNGESNSPFFNLSTLSPQNNQKLAINSLPLGSCAMSVWADVSDLPSGSYELDFSNMDSFSSDASILLFDNFVSPKAINDVRLQPRYIFQVTSDTGSFGSQRFEILVSYVAVPSHLSLQASDVCQGIDAIVLIDSTQTAVLYSLKMNGKQVGQTLIGTGGRVQLLITSDSLTTGSNNFEVWAQSADCSAASYSQVDSVRVVGLYSAKVSSTPACRSGSVTLTASGAPTDGSYNWYAAPNDSLPIEGQSSASYLTPVLIKTKTYYVSVVNSLGCEGERVRAPAMVIQFDDAVITQMDALTLQSNFATGNHWYFNDQLLADTTAELKIKSSGLYKLKVDIGGCTTTDEKTFVITGFTADPANYKAYPNPVSGLFTLELPDENNEIQSDPVVYHATGIQIGIMVLINQGTSKKGQFDFSLFPAGVYFIRIVSVNNFLVLKVIRK